MISLFTLEDWIYKEDYAFGDLDENIFKPFRAKRFWNRGTKEGIIALRSNFVSPN
jgi:hypothetical protein